MGGHDRRPVIKICGLSSVEHAQVAATNGADLLGFIFAPSRRRVDAATVRAIKDSLAPAGDGRPPFVGVFVNPARAALAETIDAAGLDIAQLSGDEEISLAATIPVPYIRAIRIGADSATDDVLREADSWMSLATPPAWLLVDAAVPGSYGGSGQQANWRIARHLAARYPTLLAGGLNRDNVAAGLAATGAAGVDVSSGVEIGGAKDADLIVRFITAARKTAQVTSSGVSAQVSP